MRIGFLIPQFTGQTHGFFWHERQALKDLGVETNLISTSCPTQEIISHDWSKQAQSETVYLVPFSLVDVFNAIKIILKAGAKSWLQCIKVVMQV